MKYSLIVKTCEKYKVTSKLYKNIYILLELTL